MRVKNPVALLPVLFATMLLVRNVQAETEPAFREGPEKPRRWFLMVAASNVYPKLKSERLIREYFDGTMRFLAPGYDDVRTVGSLRDTGLLWTPYVGFGRTVGERWAFFFQAGYTAGTVYTEANDRSIFLLPLHTEFDLRRGALYAGPGLNFYPFGLVEPGEKGLRAAKPFLGTRLMVTEATYRVKAKVRFKPFPNLVNVTVSDRWVLPSVSANIGADVPVSKNTVLELNAGYNFFFDQQSDFEGPSFTAAWKFFIK